MILQGADQWPEPIRLVAYTAEVHTPNRGDFEGDVMLDNHKKVEKSFDIENRTDLEIALELLSHFNNIDSLIFDKFRKKAVELLCQKAEVAIDAMTNPTAIILLKRKIEQYADSKSEPDQETDDL